MMNETTKTKYKDYLVSMMVPIRVYEDDPGYYGLESIHAAGYAYEAICENTLTTLDGYVTGWETSGEGEEEV